MAALYAAVETKRGGGESGSVERGKTEGFANWIGDLTAPASAFTTGRGRTKTIGLTSERSVS